MKFCLPCMPELRNLSQVLVKLSLIHTKIDLLSAPTISHACYTSTTLAYSKCGVEGPFFQCSPTAQDFTFWVFSRLLIH